MRYLITLFCIITFSGCDFGAVKLRTAQQKIIRLAVEEDWHRGIPFKLLQHASQLCHENSTLYGCDLVNYQLLDISIAFISCQQDQRTTLCREFVKAIVSNPIATMLPTAQVQPLPHSPWYWKLPTRALNELSGIVSYRNEVADWWWQEWNKSILSGIYIFLTIISGLVWKFESVRRKKEKILVQANRELRLANYEKNLQIRAQINRKKRELSTRLEHEGAIAKQQKLDAEKYEAEQKSLAENALSIALEKNEMEKADTSKLLAAVFSSPTKQSKTKRPIVIAKLPVVKTKGVK
jgi:hypothetical protein